MTERDQKIKITHKAATTYRNASQCHSDMSTRVLSVRKKSATPWIMLTRVSSMLITTESSSRRPLLGGFTTRLVTAQRLNCQGATVRSPFHKTQHPRNGGRKCERSWPFCFVSVEAACFS